MSHKLINVFSAVLVSSIIFVVVFTLFVSGRNGVIPIAGDIGKITITTDKQVYLPSETVEITIHNNTPSTITYSWHSFEYFSGDRWVRLDIAGNSQCGVFYQRPAITIKPLNKYTPGFKWTLETMDCVNKSKNETIDQDYTKVFKRGWLEEYWYQAKPGKYRAIVPYRTGPKSKEKILYSNVFKLGAK